MDGSGGSKAEKIGAGGSQPALIALVRLLARQAAREASLREPREGEETCHGEAEPSSPDR